MSSDEQHFADWIDRMTGFGCGLLILTIVTYFGSQAIRWAVA